MGFQLSDTDRVTYSGKLAVVSNQQRLIAFKNGDGFVFSIRAVDLSTAEAYDAAMKKASELKTQKAREKAEKAASDLRSFYTVKFWLRGFEEAAAMAQCSELHRGREFTITGEPVKDEIATVGGEERVFPTINVNLGKPSSTPKAENPAPAGSPF